MLKTVMLVSAIAMSAPAIAQDSIPGGQQSTQQPQVQDQQLQQIQQDAQQNGERRAKKSKKDRKAEQAASAETAAPADATASSVPAQTGDVSAETAATAQTAPAADGTIPGAPVNAAPAQSAQAAPSSAASTQPTGTATAQPAPAGTPATGATQIAQVINTEFPSYDKNTDGNLDKVEFASWMVTLKKASDPSTDAASAETTQWVNGAFAQADADKSSAVSKAELTGFLTQGAAASSGQ